MATQPLEQDNELFEAKQYEDIIFVSFKEISLLWLSSLEKKEELLSYFDRIERVPSIKVVILYEVHSSENQKSYSELYGLFEKSNIDSDAIIRMCNAFDQIMLSIIESTKLYILAQSGKILLPIFISGFACDYRIAGDNLIVHNTTPEIGLPPKGAGGFFLPRIVGPAKTEEILLSGEDMDADYLLRLKLVDRIVPSDKLKETALETARNYTSQNGASLVGVKRLVNYALKDLKNYLEYENEQIIQILSLKKAKRKPM